MTLAAEVINENIWDAVNGLVLINEVNGVKQMISVDTINGKKVRSFVETKRSEKVKEVLQLEHALTVEDEHYEFPPVQLLSEGEKKAIKGGKKAVTDT